MEMINFKKEFVERTRDIVSRIDKKNEPYEVTLLVNCMMGLVTVPTASTGNETEKDIKFQNICVKQLKEMGVIKFSSDDDNRTFRALKNSLSHIYIEPLNKNGEIVSLIFKDKSVQSNGFHTEFKFDVTQLKKYALFMADEYLKINQ